VISFLGEEADGTWGRGRCGRRAAVDLSVRVATERRRLSVRGAATRRRAPVGRRPRVEEAGSKKAVAQIWWQHEEEKAHIRWLREEGGADPARGGAGPRRRLGIQNFSSLIAS
jgi:hypothetical protein